MTSGSAFGVTLNTLLYNMDFTGLGVFLQVGAAVLLSEVMNKRFKKFAQSVLLLPFFYPGLWWEGCCIIS